jgi:PPOX class probable F420-dependent enzyme
MLDLTDQQQAHIDERLRNDPIIWLSTVRPDGRPHSVAVWFLWDGNEILIFSIPDNQKIRNIRHDPRVFLALDDTKQGEDVITVEGVAELIDEPAVNTTLPAYAQKYDQFLKDMNWTPESMSKRYSQAIRIKPAKFRGA